MSDAIVGREFYDKAIRERDEAYARMAELLNALNHALSLDEDTYVVEILRAAADAYRWLVLRDPTTKAVRP